MSKVEKDLELTWEDMRELYIIFAEVDTEIELCKTDIKSETIGYYQEVLKRFKNRMKIEKGNTYICKKDLYSAVGSRIVFLADKEYKAEFNNSLFGEDNMAYDLPEHYKLENWFELKKS